MGVKWLCQNPHIYTTDEKSAATLQVPGLDDLQEPMLVKRHGPKDFKPWGKHKQLCTQPLKSFENLGYQGQLASRMNIIAIAYIQQGLASLLKTLQEKDLNIDRAIQNVRDLYDMTNKAMDQAGRSGAFHHMIRRKAAVSDSGLDTLKDIHSKVMFLPLIGDGMFGSGLQDKLKCRKEQKEQLSDLVPEFFENKATKWKNTSYDYRSNFKQDWTTLVSETKKKKKGKIVLLQKRHPNIVTETVTPVLKNRRKRKFVFLPFGFLKNNDLVSKTLCLLPPTPVEGRLKYFLSAWEKVTSDQWILSIIKEGYKMEFITNPLTQAFETQK